MHKTRPTSIPYDVVVDVVSREKRKNLKESKDMNLIASIRYGMIWSMTEKVWWYARLMCLKYSWYESSLNGWIQMLATNALRLNVAGLRTINHRLYMIVTIFFALSSPQILFARIDTLSFKWFNYSSVWLPLFLREKLRENRLSFYDIVCAMHVLFLL